MNIKTFKLNTLTIEELKKLKCKNNNKIKTIKFSISQCNETTDEIVIFRLQENLIKYLKHKNKINNKLMKLLNPSHKKRIHTSIVNNQIDDLTINVPLGGAGKAGAGWNDNNATKKRRIVYQLISV